MASSIVKIPECANTMGDRMNPGFISVAAETLIAFGSVMIDTKYQLSVDAVVDELCKTNTDCQQTWPALNLQGKVKTEPRDPSTKVKATFEGVSTSTAAKAKATLRSPTGAAKAKATLHSHIVAAKAKATLRQGPIKTG